MEDDHHNDQREHQQELDTNKERIGIGVDIGWMKKPHCEVAQAWWHSGQSAPMRYHEYPLIEARGCFAPKVHVESMAANGERRDSERQEW